MSLPERPKADLADAEVKLTTTRACSSAVEQHSYKVLAPGSNPGTPTKKQKMYIKKPIKYKSLFLLHIGILVIGILIYILIKTKEQPCSAGLMFACLPGPELLALIFSGVWLLSLTVSSLVYVLSRKASGDPLEENRSDKKKVLSLLVLTFLLLLSRITPYFFLFFFEDFWSLFFFYFSPILAILNIIFGIKFIRNNRFRILSAALILSTVALIVTWLYYIMILSK